MTYNLDYDRQPPLLLPAPFASHHRYVVHLPPAYVLEDWPRNKTIRSRWGTFTVRVKALHASESRDLEVDFKVRLEKVRVASADFAAYHRFHEDVSRDYRVWLTLKPVRELEQAPLLESVLKWTPRRSGLGGRAGPSLPAPPARRRCSPGAAAGAFLCRRRRHARRVGRAGRRQRRRGEERSASWYGDSRRIRPMR